jgi:hypothetical protein
MLMVIARLVSIIFILTRIALGAQIAVKGAAESLSRVRGSWWKSESPL